MKLKNGFLSALLNEIALQQDFLSGENVETIYFGGGTPSLLSGDELWEILQTLYKRFSINGDAEITIETNPDDISIPKLNAWKKSGINRLSIGIQSFFDEDLLWMNRVHNAQQAEQCVILSREAGFGNLSIDLIFGTPGLSDEKWRYNVEKAVLLNIPHLSCYALTVEPKTPLEAMINKKITPAVSSDDQARQFLLLIEWLTAAGYEQYEISNYALPGKRSKHNSSYWQGKKYLGLGPSAHSYTGDTRYWNVSNNSLYLESLQKNIIPFETEWLSPVQKINEWIMTSLRTQEGINLDPGFPFVTGETVKILKRKTISFQQRGLIYEEKNCLKLSSQGKLFADGIASELFFEENEILLTPGTYQGGSAGGFLSI